VLLCFWGRVSILYKDNISKKEQKTPIIQHKNNISFFLTTFMASPYCSNILALENMPIDLVLVRHGQSEGNIYKDWGRPYGVLAGRDTQHFRLTNIGRLQAERTGEIIRREFPEGFDYAFSSDYIRAMETATHMNLDTNWMLNAYLREHSGIFKGRSNGPIPLNCTPANTFLTAISKHCANSSVIVVAHRNVLQCFHIIIEGVGMDNYEALFTRGRIGDYENCAVIHYTRRDPATQTICSRLCWKRVFVPWMGTNTGWKKTCDPCPDLTVTKQAANVDQPMYTNEELQQSVDSVHQLLDNAPEDVDVMMRHLSNINPEVI
jgi:phosphohistidine phosphatase SixA